VIYRFDGAMAAGGEGVGKGKGKRQKAEGKGIELTQTSEVFIEHEEQPAT
jgi:hypothetical protein